jgi:hypothetical protein
LSANITKKGIDMLSNHEKLIAVIGATVSREAL